MILQVPLFQALPGLRVAQVAAWKQHSLALTEAGVSGETTFLLPSIKPTEAPVVCGPFSNHNGQVL